MKAKSLMLFCNKLFVFSYNVKMFVGSLMFINICEFLLILIFITFAYSFYAEDMLLLLLCRLLRRV